MTLAALIVFSVSAALLAYILVGYPLLLGALARRRGRPTLREPREDSVSAIVAVHNGEQFLEAKLRSLLALDYPPGRLEIIVVSDGSTDRTAAIAAAYAPQGVRCLELPRGGKCAALNAGIAQATGDILLLTDVRQEVAPDSLRYLTACYADPAVGVVSGHLLIRRGERADQENIGLYWRFETWMRDQLSALDSMFGATGPFYSMRRRLAVPVPADVLLDDMYLPLVGAFFAGYRLIVEPRAVAYDYPTTLDTEFGRKVRTLAGNYQLLRLEPRLLTSANRMWLHFVSYKLGRLSLPFLLAAVAGSSFFLPAPLNWISLSAQAAFYGLAALDPWLPSRSMLKRFTSPVRTFVVMMMAAVRALAVFFVPARSLWKVTRITPSTPSGVASKGT
ncbi:MAG: glycosyltransferase family 2 protein [Bryobacteraceae bacterium]|nr:glycosyltransferase family 2 protein [Bryobacteraceae bacterium]